MYIFIFYFFILNINAHAVYKYLTNPTLEVFNNFNGALTEQYILQEIKAVHTK
jgi:hypothetical protein